MSAAISEGRDGDAKPKPRRSLGNGQATPADRPVLTPKDPLRSARSLISARFMQEGVRRLHHHRGAFYAWRDGCYREADQNAVTTAIWWHLDKALRVGPKNALMAFQPNRARVSDVFAALSAACHLPAHIEAPAWLSRADDMPPADEFLAVKNGLMHLPTETLYPATPTYFGLTVAGATYDGEAREPKEWLRFLDEIWGDDRESIEALQDIFGYLLAADTSQQKIPLIVGPKRSGKGTIARVLTALLGKDSVATPTLGSLEGNFGLAPLIGKSVAIIGDARLSGRANQAAIAERLLGISGEDSQEIDRKYLPAWTGRLPVRFVIMSNELPRLADASGALASRFIVLTMQNSFYGKEDRGLANRLVGELPGILNWAIEGFLRLRQRGHFLQPDSARDAIDELEALGSPIGAFLKEKCEISPGRTCRPEQIFEAWCNWCTAGGRKEPGTLQSFGRDLRAAVPGLSVRRPRAENGSQTRIYEGVSLLSKW